MKSTLTISIIAILAVAAMSSTASASFITLTTPDDTFMNGKPVSAEATFETGTDSITVVIENLQIDPTSVVQNMSGLSFVVDSGQTVGTMISSEGLPRFVSGDGTYAGEPIAPTGWELGAVDSSLYLYVLGTDVGPANTILGAPNASDLYANANGSIAGNKPHNPFIGQTASFELSVPGVTEGSIITEATFEFNTAPGYTVPGEPDDPTENIEELKITKFFDTNENESLDAGEELLNNWEFHVTGPDNFDRTVVTWNDPITGEGTVLLQGLAVGEYTVEEILQPGWSNTTPLIQTVTIVEGQLGSVSFGNIPEPATLTLLGLGGLSLLYRRRKQ